MDNDLHALELAQHLVDDMRRALDSRDIRLNEMSCGFFSGRGARRYCDGRASSQKPVRDGFAGAFCAAGDQDTFVSLPRSASGARCHTRTS